MVIANLLILSAATRRITLKLIRQIALAATTLLLIFAAAHFIAQGQQPVTIKFLVQAGEANRFAVFAEDFHRKHPNINVEAVKGPNNTNLVEDLYTSAFLLGDSPYDLVYMDIVWVQKFAAAGWLENLSPRLKPVELSPYLDAVIRGGEYQGNLYRMPLRTDVGMLYYRTDFLKETGANPPETFQDLIQVAQELQQNNIARWGYVWQGKQYEGLAAVFTEVLQGYGGYWIDPETRAVGLDAPEAITAVEFLRETITSGVSPEDVTTYAEEEARLLFQNGETAFLRNWPYVFPLANQSDIQGKFAIKPMVHALGLDSGACLGGWGFGISASSSHKDAAWKFIQYFNQPSIQRQYFLETGYVPARRSLFTDPQLVQQYPHYPQLLEVVEQAVLRPPIAQYAQASDILQRYLSGAVTGAKSPRVAMAAAAQETRALLGGELRQRDWER
ncbi:MAG: ABC transporter substrate-binding protein [Oscillatoriales cyanobacterium RM2_1_1]|nr:ABC transporter substrate-binding protein [Oscillatoriales cyanobacterium SM2_3_0]NJO47002.1 ABC transporter substrate-binding protein [Oscillatoriales cyanobacterium RM2_1_1]